MKALPGKFPDFALSIVLTPSFGAILLTVFTAIATFCAFLPYEPQSDETSSSILYNNII